MNPAPAIPDLDAAMARAIAVAVVKTTRGISRDQRRRLIAALSRELQEHT